MTSASKFGVSNTKYYSSTNTTHQPSLPSTVIHCLWQSTRGQGRSLPSAETALRSRSTVDSYHLTRARVYSGRSIRSQAYIVLFRTHQRSVDPEQRGEGNTACVKTSFHCLLPNGPHPVLSYDVILQIRSPVLDECTALWGHRYFLWSINNSIHNTHEYICGNVIYMQIQYNIG